MDIAQTHGVRNGAIRFSTSLKKAFVLAAALLLAVLALTFAAPASSASAAIPPGTQCNDDGNVGGQGITCDVTIVNNLDVTTGVGSSTVTTKICTGPANTNVECAITTLSYASLTTSVNQCNSAVNGGGASATCNAYVTNNITGGSTTDVTTATVNQCNGSAAGGGGTLCFPTPATTTGATINQCNNSGNGGGESDQVECTVTPSTMSAQLPVTINQCNYSADGGGSVVTCTASLTNNVLAATPASKNVLNDANTDGFTHQARNDGSLSFIGVGVLLLAGLLTAAVVARRTGAHR